jgi:hypothetical protein
MCGHAYSCQAFLLQEVDLVGPGSNLGKLEWSWLFAPGSFELEESAYEGREDGLMVLTIEPCPMPSSKRGFQRKVEEASVRTGLGLRP